MREKILNSICQCVCEETRTVQMVPKIVNETVTTDFQNIVEAYKTRGVNSWGIIALLTLISSVRLQDAHLDN